MLLTLGVTINKLLFDRRKRHAHLRRALVFIATAPLLLVGIDYLSGFLYNTSTEAHITIVRTGQGAVKRAIVILPGYLMSGSIVAEAFRPYLLPGNALVAVDYAERGVDLSDIYSKLQVALDSLQPDEVTFYGASMGGLVATGLAEIYARKGMPFGKITLVLDTAPASAGDVKRPGWLFDLGCLYRGGAISSAIFALGTMIGGFPPSSPNANPVLVRKAHQEGAWMGTAAATSQACFLRDAHGLKRDSLANTVAGVAYLHGRSANQDPLINVGRSIVQWRWTFPQLRVVTLSERSGRWHVPLVEQPAETAKAIQLPY